jgi:hypothetical protein
VKKEVIISAKTVEEAVELAVKELGAPSAEKIEYTVLEEAKKDPVRESIDTDGWVYDKICTNPKCICQTEQELPQVAELKEGIYRCFYCEKTVQ